MRSCKVATYTPSPFTKVSKWNEKFIETLQSRDIHSFPVHGEGRGGVLLRAHARVGVQSGEFDEAEIKFFSAHMRGSAWGSGKGILVSYEAN